jgi:type IV secretion system protein VirB9
VRALATATLAVVLMAGPPAAWALDTPRPGPSDPRIKVVDYDPWAVVKVTGVFRTATQIVLGEDETILHVALGDTSGWEVAAEKNILFVKPKAARGPTNLIVTSGRAGATRTYTFELSTRAGSAGRQTADTVFGLRFRYPADETAHAATVASAEAAALERRMVDLKLDRAVLEGHRNLAYEVQGAISLQPSEVSDNGRFTVLRFPANQPVRVRGGSRGRPGASPAPWPRGALHLQHRFRALRPQPRHRHRRRRRGPHGQGSTQP